MINAACNSDLAKHIDVDYKVINRIINPNSKQGSRVTPEVAVKLSLALGTTAMFWLNLQAEVDVWEVENSRFKIERMEAKLAIG